MKKQAFAFIFAIGAFVSSTKLSAQESPLTFGIKVETDFSNYKMDNGLKGAKSTKGIGGVAGGVIRYHLNSNFALQSGLDVYYRKSKLVEGSGKFKSFGVEIPVYGIYQLEMGSGKAFVGVGPYIGYGIHAKQSEINMYKKSNETGKAAMNRFDFGARSIMGYEFSKKWQIHANYQLGLRNLHNGGGSMKKRGISLGATYKF